MSEWSLSVSMMSDPWRAGIDRVVAWRIMPVLRSEYQAVVLWIDAGIVASPLFNIDVPSSSGCVRFGSKFSRMETDYEVESRKVFGLSCLLMCEDFGH